MVVGLEVVGMGVRDVEGQRQGLRLKADKL